MYEKYVPLFLRNKHAGMFCLTSANGSPAGRIPIRMEVVGRMESALLMSIPAFLAVAMTSP